MVDKISFDVTWSLSSGSFGGGEGGGLECISISKTNQNIIESLRNNIGETILCVMLK